MFSCQHCDKKFACKQNLDYHLNKKKFKCFETVIKKKKKTDFICEFCDKIYTRNINLKKHIQKNHHDATKNTNKLILKKMDEIQKQNSEIQKQNNELQKQIELLKQQNINININDNSVNDNSINNSNVTNVIVQPHTLENIDYLDNYTMGFCVRKPLLGIPKLVQLINFNPEHPENHNVHLMNKKEKRYKVFNGKTWSVMNQDEVIELFITTQTSRIEDYEENHLKLNEEDKEKLTEILDLADSVGKGEIDDDEGNKMVQRIKKIMEEGNLIIKQILKKDSIKYDFDSCEKETCFG